MAKHMQSPDGKITKKVGGPLLEQGLAAEGWKEVPKPEKKRTRAKVRTRFSEYGRPDY